MTTGMLSHRIIDISAKTRKIKNTNKKTSIIPMRTTKPTPRDIILSRIQSLNPSRPGLMGPTIFFHGEKSVFRSVVTENILLVYENRADKKLKRSLSPLPYHHMKNVGTKLM